MKIQQREKDGICIFELSGDLDFHSSPELREKLHAMTDKQVPKVLINLKKVNYIDSSGLATFVEVLQRIKKYNGKLVLTDLVPSVRGVFEIAKLDSVFSLAKSEQEAAQFLS